MRKIVEQPEQWNRPHGSFAILAGVIAQVGMSGCSAESDAPTYPGSDHARRSIAGQVVDHLYACDDGSKVRLDFLADGLTIDLSLLPDGKPERLSAPAAGLSYVGDKVNVAISYGDIAVMRPDRPTRVCHRIPGGSHQDRLQPP